MIDPSDAAPAPAAQEPPTPEDSQNDAALRTNTAKQVRIQWAILSVAVLGLLWLHYSVATHAGGLWRDEVETFQTATYPTWGQVWWARNLDSFPILIHLICRVWGAVFGVGDGVRVLGTLIGLSAAVAIGFSSWKIARALPFAALFLFACNPVVLTFGDSIRGYGLGVIFAAGSFCALWLVAQSPTRLRIAIAVVCVVGMVQSIFQGAFFVLAMCCGAGAISLHQRQWRKFWVIMGIGASAALSLAIYIPTMLAFSSPNNTHKVNLSFADIWAAFLTILNAGGEWCAWVWLLVIITVLACLIWTLFRKEASRIDKDRALYCLIVLLVGTAGFWLFLFILGFPPRDWYFIPLVGLVAPLADVALTLPWKTSQATLIRGVTFTLLAALTLPKALETTETRRTNVDLVAEKLTSVAGPQDLIVVLPWWTGPTFHRYYRGQTPWTTLPPFPDNSIQRADLLRDFMAAENPIQPVLQRIEETLRRNHTVWIVGGIAFLPPGTTLMKLPPAPHSQFGWFNAPYVQYWSYQAGSFIQQHAGRFVVIDVPVFQPVNVFENQQLILVREWRQ